MCFRKAAGVVPLLQGLTKVQIVFHSRFAAKMDFDTSHLGNWCLSCLFGPAAANEREPTVLTPMASRDRRT